MWRELSDEEKQRHMEDFTKDKVPAQICFTRDILSCLYVFTTWTDVSEHFDEVQLSLLQ